MYFKPILPPKRGYVEKEDQYGVHYYAPTQETIEELQLQNDIDSLLMDQEYRLVLLELGIDKQEET